MGQFDQSGEMGLTVLPFLALMEGGGDPPFIARWKLAAEREPDEGRRLLYRDSAIIMADLTRRQVNWHQAMEGWMERESAYINSFISRGREEGGVLAMRTAVLEVMHERLRGAVPEPIRLAVEGTNDLSVLHQWLRAAANANDAAGMRRAMNLEE